MIGRRIREARIELGLTQEQLAQDLFSRTFISGVESGRVNPSAQSICLLAERLRKPVSYFMPDEREEARHLVRIQLNQVEGLLSNGFSSDAKDLLETVGDRLGDLDDRCIADYYRLLADMQRQSGDLFASITSTCTASDRYLELGATRWAWYCRYLCAHSLYTAGLYDYSVDMGIKSLEPVAGRPEYASEEQLTHYLIGYSAFARGTIAIASHHFVKAFSLGIGTNLDVAIRSLVGQANCAMKADDWDQALRLSEQAATLAQEKTDVELTAGSYTCAAVCLVKLGELQKAGELISSVANLQGLDPEILRKAYREYLLVLADANHLSFLANVAAGLEHVMSKEPNDDDWEDIKDRWAIAKSRLVQSRVPIQETICEYARLFEHVGRYRDAADVLRFGAELLAAEGDLTAAYSLMQEAYHNQCRQ